MNIYFAPLQGYTDDAYRRVHHELCGGVDAYLTPFVRQIHGEVRSKDMRDIRRAFNDGVPVIPQIIAADADEFRQLVDVVLGEGYTHVNLNMGCPFPLQTRHGHGAGLLPHADKVREICDAMRQYSDVAFSVKMRLGLDSSDDWRSVLPVLNDAPLQHVTLHPRIATQQYAGAVDMEAFDAFAHECTHPLIYNGDMTTLDSIKSMADAYPELHGIMIGRGLLARPMLAAECKSGKAVSEQENRRMLGTMHERLYEHYSHVIPGEAALLSKIRTFWDYTEPEIGRKAWKKLKKAGNMRNYLAAVNEI